MNLHYFFYTDFAHSGEVSRVEIILSDAEFISRLYRTLEKRSVKYDMWEVQPSFLNFPKFNPNRLYGIWIEDGRYQVITGDTFLRLCVYEGRLLDYSPDEEVPAV